MIARVLILFFLSSPALSAQEPAIRAFRQGNAAYQKDSFALAIGHYREALQTKYESAALYFNLGNAYYKNGQLAESILYYEKARQLAPKDKEIAENLAVARQKTIDRFEELPRSYFRRAYLGFMTLFSPDSWAWLAIFFLAFCLGGLALYLHSPWRRAGFVGAIAGLILCILALSMAYAHQSHRESHPKAIIMVPSVYVKSGPSESAEDVFILHEGSKATVLEHYQEWYKIRVIDGKIGWVSADDLALVDQI